MHNATSMLYSFLGEQAPTFWGVPEGRELVRERKYREGSTSQQSILFLVYHGQHGCKFIIISCLVDQSECLCKKQSILSILIKYAWGLFWFCWLSFFVVVCLIFVFILRTFQSLGNLHQRKSQRHGHGKVLTALQSKHSMKPQFLLMEYYIKLLSLLLNTTCFSAAPPSSGKFQQLFQKSILSHCSIFI